ncbi:hypothetical protein [Mycobacterium talmoniae]|uniref:Diacylglycerol O-acyltransferase n=1 Tax=Mycobacterium talmoniae TaxID=1858794 RepID=A0A1S1NKW3_9MYCO|nr:hypothetical protein [Mycobacterium talmoniae]OHV04523.1 hypothetical protein BKN37_09495 [Mycobacterium talmoniae]
MWIELRAPSRARAGDGAAQDNRLSFTDQAMFLGLRATGQESVMQVAWVYEHPVQMAAVRRFHRDFGHGLYGRLIERSPLPFGRHRWVSSPAPAPFDTGGNARPRAELSDWIDERAQLPLDPEWGPGWHLGAQSFTDGSTAVSLVLSHCLADGGGALLTIADGINGATRDLGYPPPRSRTRLRAVAADAVDTARGLPEVARTLVAAAKQALRRRHDFARSGPSQPTGGGDDRGVVLPAVAVFVDTADWDARAEALGGTTYSLVAGFAAKLAERMGRRRAADGAVALLLPISDRGPGDTRANAVSLGSLTVDPTPVTTDLSGVRAAIRDAITTMRESPDESLQLLPLIPFVPKRAVKRGANVMFGFADLPVSCSNVGDLDPVIGRLDGTDADHVILRGVDRHVTRRALEHRRGLLTVVSGRVGGKISVDVVAYQPEAPNSKAWLRELAVATLAEFDLAGAVV